MKTVLQLSFLPRSADCGLLAVRLWFGITLVLNHGWAKLTHFAAMKAMVPDPLHLGPTANMSLIVFAEVLCAGLTVIGLATRFAALVLTIEFAIAFTMVHQGALSGAHSGELAFLYLGAAVALLVGGPGRISVDGA